MLLGIHLTLLVGPTIPAPAPPMLTEALDRVEVTHSDSQPSGFQLVFSVGRSGPFDLIDYELANHPLLQPFNRVVLVTTFNATPRVLMDGVITRSDLSPGQQPGTSRLTITGEDVSVMMDLEERSIERPAENEVVMFMTTIGRYAEYQLVPMIIPPPTLDVTLPLERVRGQRTTDFKLLTALARCHGYVFYIAPGPLPGFNTAYFGPPVRLDFPQRALSANMGPLTNVSNLHFSNHALSPTRIEGYVQDPQTGQVMPVQTFGSVRPPLAAIPAWATNRSTRTRQYRQSGNNIMRALGCAQGETERASDTVTASGELDALRYGGLLQARGVVGVRGVGYSNDGLYYVQQVTHTIAKGSYKQRFTLRREGQGSTTAAVVP